MIRQETAIIFFLTLLVFTPNIIRIYRVLRLKYMSYALYRTIMKNIDKCTTEEEYRIAVRHVGDFLHAYDMFNKNR